MAVASISESTSGSFSKLLKVMAHTKRLEKGRMMRKKYLRTTPLLCRMKGFWDGVLWGMGFREALPRKRRKCKFCSRRIPADAKYCPYCGRHLK
jgi:hypothetical protein